MIKDGNLKFTVRNVPKDIPTDDYYKLVAGDFSFNSQQVYLSILKMFDSLNILKEVILQQYKINLSPELEIQLREIHDALIALDYHKELLFKSNFEKNKDETIQKAFELFQELVGNEVYIPIDYRLSLLELMTNKSEKKGASKKGNDTILNYFRLAKNEKFKSLHPSETASHSSITDSESMREILLQTFYSFQINERVNDVFINNYDNVLATKLSVSLNELNIWIIAKAGSEFNTQIVTDSIELALVSADSPGETKETKRERDAIKNEKDLSAFQLPEERAFAGQGFRSHEKYGVKVKNEWIVHGEGKSIEWEGTFATKKIDGTFTNTVSHGSIDFSKIEGLKKEYLKEVLKFVFSYAQSIESTKKAIAKRVSLNEIPVALRLAMNDNEEFWKGLDSESVQNLENPLLITEKEKVTNNYLALIDASARFSRSIDQAMLSAFVDKNQSFEDYTLLDDQEFFIESNDEDFFDEEDISIDEFEMMDSIVDEKTVQEMLAQQIQPSRFGSAYKMVTNTFFSVTGTLGSAVTFVPKLAYNFLSGLIQINDPAWVTKKYDLATSLMLSGIQQSEEITQIVKESQKEGWQSSLGKLVEPIFIEQKNNPRYAHSQLLESLRGVLNSKEYKTELAKKIDSNPHYDKLVDVVLKLCQIRFEGGHLYAFCDQLVGEILPNGGPEKGSLSEGDFPLIEHVDASKKLSAIEVNSKKLQGHFNVNFDPHLQGNIPFVLGTVEIGEKPVTLLRMGTPTIQGFTTTEINPEFRGYLQNLTLENKKHLYVSLQNDKVKGIAKGDESGRNGVIKKLQKEFKDNFFAVVLAQDSHFYKQVDNKGVPLGDEDANIFKQTFYNQLKGMNTGFYFPDDWKNDDEFNLGLKSLLESVHTAVFVNEDGTPKTDLTRQEKKDFIEIYYAYLSIFLMKYSGADNVNITCKDAIDRAGKLNSLVLKLIMTIQGKSKDPQQQRVHQVFTHAPAFFVKSQAIIHSRLERLLSAFKVMTHETISKRIYANINERGEQILPIAKDSRITIKT